MTDELAWVTAEAVQVVPPADGSLDVLLDGRRVWSCSPAASPRRSAGGVVRLPWPDVLRPYLQGVSEVVLQVHPDGEVLFRGEVRFGSASGRVAVVDDAGRPLALNKYGRLTQPLESYEHEIKAQYLDRVEEVLGVIESCGLPGYLAWGTLLGAVREGRMIGHDSDADVGFLSDHASPADVMADVLAVERALRRRDWNVHRENGGFLGVSFDLGGVRRNIDVFAGWFENGWFYQVHHVRARLPESALRPLRQVTLEGRGFPAPRDSEAWLTAGYGPRWRVPDPTFTFGRDRARDRRVHGWLGGLRTRRAAWRRAYAREVGVDVGPSATARWAHDNGAGRSDLLVDLGCGRGGDVLWLAASLEREVLGFDMVPAVLGRASRLARQRGVPAHFEVVNFADLRHALHLGALLARTGPCDIYSRRLLGDMPGSVEPNFWRTVGMAMRSGGRLYLEFLTDPVKARDLHAPVPPVLGADPEATTAELRRLGGRVLSVEHFEEPDEPAGAHVCRIVAEWSG